MIHKEVTTGRAALKPTDVPIITQGAGAGSELGSLHRPAAPSQRPVSKRITAQRISVE
jgi:hypothetical protein